MNDAQKKLAIVTGAAQGVGFAAVEKFLREGWQVAMMDVDSKALTLAMEQLDLPDDTLAIECDVSSPDDVNDAIEKIVDRFGRIDSLINNAGTAELLPILDTDLKVWSRIMAVNLNGPFLCTQACVPVMLKKGVGSVVNIVSISGLRASILRTAYGTSKAALIHLTKQQALEFGAQGVRVNAVAPGPVDTALAQREHSPAMRADYYDAIPLNRYGTEPEIAEAIFFLASNKASYINGQILAVDGGFESAGIGLPTLRKG